MAFDAAAASAVTPLRTSAKGQGAARSEQGGEQSPFGALMSLLDGAGEPQETDAGVPVAARLKGGTATAETSGVQAEAEKQAPDAEAAAEAAPPAVDSTPLAFAMMTPPPPPPVIDPPVAGAQTTPSALSSVATSVQPAAAAGGNLIPEQSKIAVLPDESLQSDAAPEPKAPVLASAPVEAAEVTVAEPAVAAQPATPKGEPSPPPFAPAKGLRERQAELEPRQTTGDIRRAEAGGRDVAANGVPEPASQGGDAEGHAFGDRPHDGSPGGHEGQARGQTDAAPAAAVTSLALAADQPVAAAPAESASTTNAPMSAPAAPTPAVSTPAVMPAAVPVRGSPETVAHLAAQMIQRLDGQSTRFDLALTPESMGRVQVRIEIDRQGALKAHMSFENPTTAQDMGGRHAELRAALESAGFDLADGALSFDVASGGEGRGEAFRSQQDALPHLFQSIAEAADPAPVPSAYFNGGARSAVDIRV